MEYLYLFLLLFGKPVYLYLYASNLSIARTNRRLYRYKDLPHSFFSCLPLRTVHFEMNSTALHYYKCIHQDWHKIIWHQTCHCISIDSFRLEFSRACAQANRRSRCLFVSRAFFATPAAFQSIVHKPLTYCPGWNLYTSWLLPISPQWLTRKVSFSLRQPDKVVIYSWLTQKKVGLHTPFHKLHEQNVWKRLILE